MPGGGALREATEVIGFAREAELCQRARAEGRVTDPAVSVIPVARAADPLGKRRGGRGGDRAGHGVLKPSQHRGRADRSRIVDLRRAGPVPPPLEGVVEPLVELLRVVRLGLELVDLVGSGVDDREPHALPFVHGELDREVVVVTRLDRVGVGPDHEPVVAADRAVEAVAMTTNPRSNLAEVEPRDDLDPEAHRSLRAVEDAQDLSVRVALTAFAHRQAVREPRLAAVRAQGRLEHERPFEVAARALLETVGRDRAAAAAVPVEESSEAARGVETREAAPVDRSFARYERRRVAVGDEAVVRNRRIGILLLGHTSWVFPAAQSTPVPLLHT